MTQPDEALIAELRAKHKLSDDNFIASGDDLTWLARQLAAWPERVDQDSTTNLRFLRESAALTLEALSRPTVPDRDGIIEECRRVAVKALSDFGAPSDDYDNGYARACENIAYRIGLLASKGASNSVSPDSAKPRGFPDA